MPLHSLQPCLAMKPIPPAVLCRGRLWVGLLLQICFEMAWQTFSSHASSGDLTVWDAEQHMALWTQRLTWEDATRWPVSGDSVNYKSLRARLFSLLRRSQRLSLNSTCVVDLQLGDINRMLLPSYCLCDMCLDGARYLTVCAICTS